MLIAASVVRVSRFRPFALSRFFLRGTVPCLLLITSLLAVGCAAPAMADVPLPDFTEYQVLDVPHPPSDREPWRESLDVGLLGGALVAASYLAVWRRSRRGLVILAFASLAWFGFVREGCICPIGALQNVAVALGDSSYAVPWYVVATLALPLLFTLLFGRTFCAAVCPLGALQEAAAIRPVRLPAWVDQTLGLVPFLYLGLAVAVAVAADAFLICRYDPLVAFFRLSGSTSMLIFGGAILLVGVFVARPYCRFLCPLGAILGLLSRVAWRHVSVAPNECINCRLCEDVCPYNAIKEPTIAPSPAERGRSRRRLTLALASLPILLGLGFAAGSFLATPLAKLHPRVRLAERFYREETGQIEGTIDATNAFRQRGDSPQSLYDDAQRLRQRIAWAGMAFGAWTGLVIGAKAVQLSIRRRRDEYLPDRAKCVSCGRCFWYCPKEKLRRGLIDESELPTVVASATMEGSTHEATASPQP